MSTPEPSIAPFLGSRDFDAPRALLWKAYTDPEHCAKWFGPQGTEVLRCDMDLRAGGSYHYGMRMPDGNEMWGLQKFLSVTPGEQLVLLQSFSDASRADLRHPASATWPLQMHSTTTFEDLGSGRCRLSIRWLPHAADEAEIRTFDQAREGMSGGFEGMFEQLAAYLAKMT